MKSTLNYTVNNKLILLLICVVMFMWVAVGDLYAGERSNKEYRDHFVATKSNKVNVRTGPGLRYPIKWIFVKENEPLQTICKVEQWYHIVDITGNDGWIHSSMISGKRFAIVVNDDDKPSSDDGLSSIFDKANVDSKVIAKIESKLRVYLISCKKNWCKIKVNAISGWIKKFHLWGVCEDEVF